ncbi:pyridoxamine kinase [Clostridium fallax]|uniref:pyridoxal kinase n=1 Tax=Clostridium fallax TaxID=1533 RepID=A0A1M4W3H8_9CLOT|nr:pyridoxamine kinase [Clostridium fallax]SHE75715.1 pyridoxine kinase [Clostridium fallax]SQB22858.1 pyridoxamine kinase [Clostridium fallax]
MKKPVKRVMAIHDLCGYGRAALMNIIPIMAYKEIEVCPVPTMVLSTHTGGFGTVAKQGLNDFMERNFNHWKELKLEFDCVYTGYLGGINELKITEKFIKEFKNRNNLIVVDPVFGDNHKLYSNMEMDMVEGIRNLIKYSDVITPNYTEACYLVGLDPKEPANSIRINKLIKGLKDLGSYRGIITSIEKENELGVIWYENDDDYKSYFNKRCLKSYGGTGDIFTSALISYYINGETFDDSVMKAMDFVVNCIKVSSQYDYNTREGILIEKSLSLL